MSEPSSEQEKYTIEEMMDRLKSRDDTDGDGELVTRSDGSQAMKIKKRKRRSNQAVNKETKRNQKIQLLQIAGLVILVAVVGLALGIGVLYANSTSFRERLIAKAEHETGAKVTLKEFRMNPITANASQVLLEWPSGNALDSLILSGVSATIAPVSFLGKTFKGEEIKSVAGELLLKAPLSGDFKIASDITAISPGIRFDRYAIPRLDVYFGERNAANMLEKTEASLFAGGNSGQAEIRFSSGTLKIEGWPSMVLDRSYIRSRNTELQVESMRFMVPPTPNQRSTDKGYIDFSGTIKPLERDSKIVLNAKLEAFRLSYLLGPDLGRFFLGSVETKEVANSNFLSLSPGSDKKPLLELSFANSLDSRIDVSNFKFLSQLRVALEDRWYDLPNFDNDISIVVKRRGAEVEISEINLEQRGRMALRGNLSNGPSGELKGTLRIGLPEAILASRSNQRLNRMFGEVREDYRWMDIKIGGTSASPADNFLEQYESTDAESAADSQPAIREEDSFENLIDGQ